MRTPDSVAYATRAGDVVKLQGSVVVAWEAFRRTDGVLAGLQASLMGGAALGVETIADVASTSP